MHFVKYNNIRSKVFLFVYYYANFSQKTAFSCVFFLHTKNKNPKTKRNYSRLLKRKMFREKINSKKNVLK